MRQPESVKKEPVSSLLSTRRLLVSNVIRFTLELLRNAPSRTCETIINPFNWELDSWSSFLVSLRVHQSHYRFLSHKTQ